MLIGEIQDPNESKIVQFIQNQEFHVSFYRLRYGGMYLLGIFDDEKDYEEMRESADCEYMQSEFRQLFFYPGVLPYVECNSLPDGYVKLEALLSKLQHVEESDYYKICDMAVNVFSGEDLNMREFDEAMKAMKDFKAKWKL